MPTIAELVDAERRMRALLEREGLPAPDEVQYREASVALFWHATKTVVIVDIDEADAVPPPAASPRGGPG